MKNKFIKDADKAFWNVTTEKDWKEYHKRIYKNTNFEIKGKVLSIGEGQGYFLNFLNIKEATIIDLCDYKNYFGYKFIKKDITKKLNINENFDTIFIMETLEHLKNPLYLMSQVYDLLSEEGICYVCVPYTPIDKENMEDIVSHKWRWKDYQLKEDLEMIGFKVKFLLKRLRFKNTAFFLPHCCLIVKIRK